MEVSLGLASVGPLFLRRDSDAPTEWLAQARFPRGGDDRGVVVVAAAPDRARVNHHISRIITLTCRDSGRLRVNHADDLLRWVVLLGGRWGVGLGGGGAPPFRCFFRGGEQPDGLCHELSDRAGSRVITGLQCSLYGRRQLWNFVYGRGRFGRVSRLFPSQLGAELCQCLLRVLELAFRGVDLALCGFSVCFAVRQGLPQSLDLLLSL